ncbi:MAG: di-heme-cytochrome C peroxidase, partial [Verrucomicrobiota bacterium]
MKKTARILIIALAALVLAGIVFWRWFTSTSDREHVTVAMPRNIQWLDTGLSDEDRLIWHHLPEGSELAPLSVLEALHSPRTGKPFLYSLADYGFLLESEDPHKLPIGWSTHLREIGQHKVPFIGINCAACHTGEIQYRGNTLRIDGAPNLFSLEDFFIDLRAAISEATTNRSARFKFVRDVIRLNHDAENEGEFFEISPAAFALLHSVDEADGFTPEEQRTHDAVADAMAHGSTNADKNPDKILSAAPPPANAQHEQKLREIVKVVVQTAEYIHRRLQMLGTLAHAIDSGVELGPGRGDSFGIIRDLVFSFDGIQLDAPVSTPHLFNFGEYNWLHWDGNTTSVMQRNVAQAIALGADYDPLTRRTSALPYNLHHLETVARKIKAPAWPETILGPIDRAKAANGKAHFQQARCAECHSSEKVYSLEEVGTSPVRAANFAFTLAGVPFHEQLAVFAANTEAVLVRDQNISAEVAAKLEPGKPEWRATKGYIARSLHGTWASAPYLHNGSV